MIKNNEIKRLVKFFYELGTLRKIPRAHKQTLFTNDESDNIASHSNRVAWLGWFLAKIEGADANVVVMMCLMHDLPETRSGDQNWVHKKYVTVHEEEIIEDQYNNLPFGDILLEIAKEYQKREILEAIVAKDADILDQMLLLREHQLAGNKEASRWLIGKEEGKRLKTKSAKIWAREICQQRPSQWWDNLWTSERR